MRKQSEKAAFLLAGVFLIGCSSKPPMRPVNEIHEPVFYRLDYLAAEVLAGTELVQDSAGAAHEPNLLFRPRVHFDKNITPWASFTFWPLYWNLLLTGDQYDAGGNPAVGKLNVIAHAGINGLGYSSRDGWYLGAAAGLRAKYLFGERLFLRANLLAEAPDLGRPDAGLVNLETDLGFQATAIHSVLFSHSLSHHRAGAGGYFRHHRIRHFDGDLHNEVRLGHKAYLTPSHIVGPEIGYGFRNHAVGEEGYFLVGLQYRYVVE
jgi:hypothetical protein